MTTTKDGIEIATAKGRGVGRRTTDLCKIRYASALFNRTNNSIGKPSVLNNLIGVNEYESGAPQPSHRDLGNFSM